MPNKSYVLIIALFAALFNLPSCANANKYTGRIDANFVQFVQNQENGSNIELTSEGGNEDSALKAADIIINKRLTATIRGYCMSACVDFLFPAFEKINLDHFPTIGLHGNTHLTNIVIQKTPDQLSKIPEKIQNDCLKKEQHLMAIWQAKRTNYSVIDNNLLESEIRHIRVTGKGCGVVLYGYGFWFPTSRQLSQIFGEKFSGNVCADNEDCINKVIINGAKTKNFKKIKVGSQKITISENK